MNRKSKVIQERNARIQQRSAQLRREHPQWTMITLYAQLATEEDLSVERIKKIVNKYRL